MLGLEGIVARAEALGASEAEVYFRKVRVITVRFADRLESVTVNSTSGYGIRVAVGRRVAVVGVEDVSREGLEDALKSAVAIARTTPEDEKWVSLPRSTSTSSVEGCFCSKTAGISSEDAVEIALEAMQGVSEGSSISKPVRGGFEVAVREVAVANSYSQAVSRMETIADLYVTAKAEELSGSVTFTRFKICRSIDELNARALGVEAGSEAPRFLGAKRMEEGIARIVLHPEVVCSMIDVMLSQPLSAEAVQKGRSPLAGRIGQSILSEKVTIVDEGAIGRWIGARSFDDEGIATRNNTLIDKGILRSFVYDTYTAYIDGRESTGNAWRSLSSTPRPSPNMLVLKPGDSSLDDMVSEVGEGYYIVSTIGEWLSNPISGLMQATVTHAYRIRGGELAEPVKGAVVTADFYEAFGRNLLLVGRDITPLRSSVAPAVALEGVRVSG
ncbi:MAG: TldD/PmbA family protein [Candidatus Bathyarchaeota archaeon]|nr:TldD/PmbA family protein [Candidatus Bathyarchaeota archaeon]